MSLEILTEASLLGLLRERNLALPSYGFLETATGARKVIDDSHILVRIGNKAQEHGRINFFTATATIALTVMRADDASGLEFAEAFESLDDAVLGIILGIGEEELTNPPLVMDGAMLTATDSEFDDNEGLWRASWELQLHARIEGEQ